MDSPVLPPSSAVLPFSSPLSSQQQRESLNKAVVVDPADTKTQGEMVGVVVVDGVDFTLQKLYMGKDLRVKVEGGVGENERRDGAGRQEGQQEEHEHEVGPGCWFPLKAGCALFALHAAALLLFTCSVILMTHWANRLTVDKRDILINKENGKPMGLQPLVSSTSAWSFIDTEMATSANILSVIATVDRDNGSSTSGSENDQDCYARQPAQAAEMHMIDGRSGCRRGPVQKLYSVAAVEVLVDKNTTILWLSGGQLLHITPSLTWMFDMSSQTVRKSWKPSDLNGAPIVTYSPNSRRQHDSL
eukprot:GHVS01084309.1.p1 GENE.GHVS01084309.1~~GHVS01084309.1.p1  ORF type:complete len:302 (+),score=42.00 GHVS01084309.1:143-1048(+)